MAEDWRLTAELGDEGAGAGLLGWLGEVRVELPGHDETSDLADRLEREGIPIVRRWRYLLAGAASEADARELAERLRREAPAGTRVEVEAGGEMVWEVTTQNPFAIFG